MVLAFIKKPTYGKRFDFYGVVERTVKSRLEGEFAMALGAVLATARSR